MLKVGSVLMDIGWVKANNRYICFKDKQKDLIVINVFQSTLTQKNEVALFIAISFSIYFLLLNESHFRLRFSPMYNQYRLFAQYQ